MKKCVLSFLQLIRPDFPVCRQEGSVIVVVLMLLVIMSIIGVASTNTTVTENFIVRNSSIRKQNLHLADALAAEANQRVIDFAYDDPDFPDAFLTHEDIDPDLTDLIWVHDKDEWETNGHKADWYNPVHAGRVLDKDNSEAPQSLIDNTNSGIARILSKRGEWDFGTPDDEESPIRYALVGWDHITEGGESITEGASEEIKKGSILVEYVSKDYGVIRLVVGVRLKFS